MRSPFASRPRRVRRPSRPATRINLSGLTKDNGLQVVVTP
jgi:hypothetical protein